MDNLDNSLNLTLFDTHAHLNDPNLFEKRHELVERAEARGVKYINVVGYDIESSLTAVKIAAEFENVYAIIGIHPHDAQEWDEDAENIFRELLEEKEKNKIVAIGEIGFDLHFDDRQSDEVQISAFLGQMKLAYDYELAVSIHSRDASELTLAKLEEIREEGYLRDKPGVIHCFDYDTTVAKEFQKYDFLFGVDGPVTFKNGADKRELVKYLDASEILLETDCPYMAPEPFRGKQNEPSLLFEIAKKIADEKEMGIVELARITSENGKKIFKIN